MKVVDLTESTKANKNVFIHFTKRLHSWTTIKVSYSSIFGAKLANVMLSKHRSFINMIEGIFGAHSILAQDTCESQSATSRP